VEGRNKPSSVVGSRSSAVSTDLLGTAALV
jgi:hypothetical protein